MLACYYWSSTILSRGINFRSHLREVMIKININIIYIYKDLNLELRRWSENEIEWKGLELYAQYDSRKMWEIKKKRKERRSEGEKVEKYEELKQQLNFKAKGFFKKNHGRECWRITRDWHWSIESWVDINMKF